MMRTFYALIPSTWVATIWYAFALLSIGLMLKEPAWICLGTVLMTLALTWHRFYQWHQSLRADWQQRVDATLKLGGTLALLTIYEIWSQKPAYAFLGRACRVLLKITEGVGNQGQGSEAIANLIRATVYIIRGLFLIYFGIAAVNVFRQMQSGEDWQTAARAPLVAVILVAAVEGISFLVAPESGGSEQSC